MRTRLLAIAACVLAALAVVLPAAANEKPTTGTRIALGSLGPVEFAANTPFYIEHGFVCDLGDGACLHDEIGGGVFTLYVDGVLQSSTVDAQRLDSTVSKLFLSNFATGLPAGVHTLYGVWRQFGVVTQTVTKSITFS